MVNIVRVGDDDPVRGPCEVCGEIKDLHLVNINGGDVTGWVCMSCILF
jgi:hypothetical protein